MSFHGIEKLNFSARTERQMSTTLQSSLTKRANEILTRGYTVLEDVLSEEQVEKAKAALDKILDYEGEHGHKVLWDNPYYHVSYFVIAKEQIFREICQAPKLLEFARLMLGPDCIIGSVNGYTTRPNGRAQRLHPDRLFPKGFLGSLTANLVLDEFTAENGCTRVIPYSQGHEVPPGADKTFGCELLEPQVVDVEAPPGAVILYDANLVHASGENRTPHRRTSVHVSFLKPWIQPEWDFTCLPDELKSQLSEDESRLFGLNSAPQRYDFQTLSQIKAPKKVENMQALGTGAEPVRVVGTNAANNRVNEADEKPGQSKGVFEERPFLSYMSRLFKFKQS